MKEVIHKSNVPAGGYYYYVDPDSGAQFKHPYYAELFNMATKHRTVNNFKLGDDWELVFSDIVCSSTPSAVCADSYSQDTLSKMTRFGKALLNWAKQGFPVCTEEQLAERRAVCESCIHFGGAKEILKVGCKKCGCSGLKLALSSERCPDNPPRWKAIV
jgi:hypothetical protein